MPQHLFGPFVLDAGSGRLIRDGEVVSVGQRGLAVLQTLAEAGGGVVAKAELMEKAWPGTIVEEGNLTVQVAALRKALGAAPDGQEWIVTVPRVGYRLARPGSATSAAPPAQPALAVLPFANLSGDAEQEYFADGVVEDIITALSRFRNFSVIARNSSFAYRGRAVDVRQVAKELGVRYVLEGSVRRAGEQLRISAQLVEADTGAHLWAEHFDGALSAVFDFQDRITEAVATLVAPHIHAAEIARSRAERPGSVAAYDILLQAVRKINKETDRDNAEAYALLTHALALDPDNAMLLSHAAWALDHRGAMGWPPIGPDDRQKCTELARRALQRAAGDPTVMGKCGVVLIQTAKEYDWGMAVLEAAAKANPNNLLIAAQAGVGHLHCGNVEDALAYFHRAIRLSPNDQEAHMSMTGVAHAEMVLGNYTEALAWAARALALNTTFDPTFWMLIAANAHLGRMAEARRFLEALKKLAPEVTIASIRAGQAAKDPGRVAAILEGLRLAGLEEG